MKVLSKRDLSEKALPKKALSKITLPKKWAGLIAVAVLACSISVVAGCSSQQASSASASSASSSSVGSSQSSAASEASASGAASMANPWSNAASAEEAAKGAGLAAFALPTGAIADLGEPFQMEYRFMEGMAEARFEFPASAVTARTGASDGSGSADISGDYNTYAHEWTEDIGGITVNCAGNREGDSTKTYWTSNGMNHSLVAEGLGGDMDFGLNTERLRVFVEAMK